MCPFDETSRRAPVRSRLAGRHGDAPAYEERHWALSDPKGRLEVTWSVEEQPEGGVLRWIWNEHDGPPVASPTRESFGHQLLRNVLTYQIKATVEIASDPDGLRVSIDMPLNGRAQPSQSLRLQLITRGHASALHGRVQLSLCSS